MACGVPCVVTDVGDSAWLVGDPASVVPPGDSEALARALGTAIKRLGQNGIPGGTHARRRIEGLFSVDQLADRTLDALNAAVNRRVAQYAASCVDDACAMK
jgi:glycosyltransferase involved in cell wall biosynthesis